MRIAVALTIFLLIGAGLLALSAGATTDAKPVPAREVQLKLVGKFDFPDYVVSPPGDASRLFVVEKAGRIRVVLNGSTLAAPFLDISSEVAPGNEPGLLSLAFSPGYARNGLFYIYYSGTRPRVLRLLPRARRSSSHQAVAPAIRSPQRTPAAPTGLTSTPPSPRTTSSSNASPGAET